MYGYLSLFQLSRIKHRYFFTIRTCSHINVLKCNVKIDMFRTEQNDTPNSIQVEGIGIFLTIIS